MIAEGCSSEDDGRSRQSREGLWQRLVKAKNEEPPLLKGKEASGKEREHVGKMNV